MGEDVLDDVRVALQLLLECHVADCSHRWIVDVTEATKERASVDEKCETGTMIIDGKKDIGVKRGERNTFSVDFGFTSQLHEHNGHNKFGELLLMILVTTKIERFKMPPVQLDNSLKQQDTSVSDANSKSAVGGISELKYVAGRILSKMQRGYGWFAGKISG